MAHMGLRRTRLGCVSLLLIAGCLVVGTRPYLPDTAQSRATQLSVISTTHTAPDSLHNAVHPLSGGIHDYDPLIALIGDAQFVLLGEASHGTHEFYRERARITRRLVEEKGFTAVAIEGDWPNAERVNRYVQGISGDMSAEQSLADFTEFPEWMWANTDVADFVRWLRSHNAGLAATNSRVGFYGLDLYSLARSADAVVSLLEQRDPVAARRARERYQCFAPFDADPIAYGRAVASQHIESCEDAVTAQLEELEASLANSMLHAPLTDTDKFQSMIQNARAVKNAEAYYRTLFTNQGSTWNLRDQHMADTLDALGSSFTGSRGLRKVVAWAHNTHTGDARATEMGENGQWNVGQLMRERHPNQVVLVGFTTYSGTVVAASAWDEPGERKNVLPALPESYSARFHDLGIGNFLLPLRDNPALASSLDEPRLERAIGVIYLPQTERFSHYFEARLSAQFDAVIHWDITRAVEPLNP